MYTADTAAAASSEYLNSIQFILRTLLVYDMALSGLATDTMVSYAHWSHDVRVSWLWDNL